MFCRRWRMKRVAIDVSFFVIVIYIQDVLLIQFYIFKLHFVFSCRGIYDKNIFFISLTKNPMCPIPGHIQYNEFK
jgi:hypothetical protein